MTTPLLSQERVAVTKVKELFPEDEALLELTNPKEVIFWLRTAGFIQIAPLYATSKELFEEKNDAIMAVIKELSAIDD